jgi:hypothetical protein
MSGTNNTLKTLKLIDAKRFRIRNHLRYLAKVGVLSGAHQSNKNLSLVHSLVGL